MTVFRTRRKTTEKTDLNRLQKLSLFFFNRPRRTAFLWLLIVIFGALSYSTLLKREGFPSIETPLALAKGSYLVNDPAKVDQDISKPLSEFLLKKDGVKTVQTQSFDNYYSAQVIYNENVNAESRSSELAREITDSHILPQQATINLEAYKFGFTERGDDLVVAFYAKDSAVPNEKLVEQAKKASGFIKSQNLPLVDGVSALEQYESAINPATGQSQLTKKSFDRYGERSNNQSNFYPAALIGISAPDKTDNIELDKQVREAIGKLNANPEFKDYIAVISASYAPDIKSQISELQKALLEGLAVILVVGSILIAIRASVITVIAMVTVIAAVNALLYAIGYTLNTITLFSLVLGLSLIVDDTIIMSEAIDSQRRRQRDAKQAISVATRKIGKAMVAATLTAALSFAPFLFVGGILGSFIRAIPITIISALLISLLVALVFIPLFSRFFLLGKKQMGAKNVHETSAGIEARIARFISAPMLWARNSHKKLLTVVITAVVVGFGFIGAGVFIFKQNVKFNIFPPEKDSNQLQVTLTFSPDTNIEKAENIADKTNSLVGDDLKDNFARASYYGQANVSSATLTINLLSYKERDIASPQIAADLQQKFNNFDEAQVKVGQLGAGGPEGQFSAHVDAGKDRSASQKFAEDLAAYIQKTEIKRPNGTIARIENVSVDNTSIFTRNDNTQYIGVNVKFADKDTSALFTILKGKLEKEFSESRVAAYGLDKRALTFELGQEQENQDSFKTLAIAFPLLLLVMYLLLATQFRSLLQPLLIFMALPFSFFGIALGLYLSNNPFSFFSALGFFALIGLSLKNTILLVDYANQARRAGRGAVDAAHEALAERFRPLIATSLTAVFSLIPLAIASPFWEGLAVVLICGLLSSTFLVITVFPYYYLGAEYLRSRISRKNGLLWVALTIILGVAILKLPPVLFAPLISALLIMMFSKKNIR